eukprot:8237187-Pyramimonas_sp.AAC.1
MGKATPPICSATVEASTGELASNSLLDSDTAQPGATNCAAAALVAWATCTEICAIGPWQPTRQSSNMIAR